MKYAPPPILMLLDKVFIITALAGSLAWLIDYTRHRGWQNPLGRTLITKTAVITLLLGLSAATEFLPLNSLAFLITSWAGVVLLGSIGPIMVWRMIVFRRFSKAGRDRH